jgi:hypothetical protein
MVDGLGREGKEVRMIPQIILAATATGFLASVANVAWFLVRRYKQRSISKPKPTALRDQSAPDTRSLKEIFPEGPLLRL